MATTPDPFASPMLGRMGVSAMPDPYAPWTPTSNVGLGGLSPSLADMAVQAERIVRGTQFTLPEIKAPTGPTRLYNPTTKEVFVNGFKFGADDEAAALQSEQYLGRPPVPAPEGDWVPLDDTAYRQYLQGIRDPSIARQFSRSFGRGVDYTQMLAGRGLQLAGAEQLGGRIVAQQMKDLRKTQPYAREFTDVEDIGDLGMWLVSVFGELGPNIVESIATAGVGALVGFASSGNPLGGAAAGLASLVSKQSWKESVKAALKRRATGQAALPNDAKLIRTAAAIGGATAATLASGYATGAADIYGEIREQGAGPESASARALALLGAVPYAALDVVPEAVLVKRLLGQAGARPELSSLATRKAKAGELLKRGAVGGAVGGTLEGAAEAGQEALLLGAPWLLSLSDQELGSAENIKRLINAFAAGTVAGGVLGAGANILNPTDLLDPNKTAEPSAATVDVTPTGGPLVPVPGTGFTGWDRGGYTPPPPGTAVVPFSTPVTPIPSPVEAPPVAGLLPGTPPLLEGPMPPVSPVGEPVMMVTPQGQAYPDQMLQQRADVPPGAPGTQGVLDVFGGSISAQELGTRMQPQVAAPTPAVPPAPTGLSPEEAAAQGVLQFAPEAPEGRPAGTMANRLREIQDRLRREREFSAAQTQLLAQREAELEALAQQSRNARDIFEMEQRPPMPMVPATPRQPRQLPLFPPGSLPGPTRRQRQAAATPLAEIPPGATRLRRQRAQRPQEQLPLPYVATNVTPEIARATWNDRRPPTVRKWEALSEEAQQKWTDAIIAAKATPALRAQISREETQARLAKSKEKPSAVQEQGAATVPAQPGAAVGEGVGAEVPSEAPPTGKGTKLKRGKKAKAAKPLKPPAPPPPPPPPPSSTAGADREQRVNEMVRRGELVQAGRLWSQYADKDTQPKWTELSDAQKEAWRKVAIEDNRPTMAAAEKIAPPKKEPPPPKPEEAAAPPPPPTLPEDTNFLEPGKYVYHAVRSDEDIQGILDDGLRVGTNVSFDTNGQAFSGEGATILVFLREDVAPSRKGYQNDGTATKRAKPVAILKDTSLEADRPTRDELEEQGTAAYEEEQKLSDYAKREYGLTDEDILQYTIGARKIKDAPTEAQPTLKRILAQSKLSARLLDEADKAPETAVSAAQVLDRYRKYGVPVRQVNMEWSDADDRLNVSLAPVSGAPARVVSAVVTETPAEVWAEMDTGVEWTALSPQQQAQWTDSDRSQNTADTIAEDVRNPQTPEALWEDLKPLGAPTFDKLPPLLRTQWIQDVATRKATIARAEEMVEDLSAEDKRGVRTEQLSVAEQVDEAIREIEEMVIDRDAMEVFPILVFHAYFDKDSNNAKTNQKARDFLSSRVFSEEMQRIMDDVFMAHAHLETKLVASYRKGADKGTARPWFAYAKRRNLLSQIKAEITNYPRDHQPATADAPVVQTTEEKTEHTPQAILANLIDELITKARIMRDLSQPVRLTWVRETDANLRDAASRLYAQLDEQGRRYLLRGYPLSDYFTPEGMPKLVKVDDRWIITTRQLTREELQQRERERKLAAKSAEKERIAEARRAGREASQYDDSEGAFYRDDGTPLTSTVPPGRVRLLINAFVAKLRRKPTIHVYANVEDLKQRNPELYRRAAASRPQGDFDTTKSAGFSFGSPEAAPRMSRRMFLRAAGAALGALKLPPLSKDMQVNALKAAFEGSLKASDVWFAAAKAAVGKNDYLVGMLEDAESGFSDNMSVYSFIQSKELKDYFYYIEYEAELYDDPRSSDDVLKRMLSRKDGVEIVADLQQALQAQRSALLAEINKKSSPVEDKYPGAHVIIFTDFIRTEQHLRFVLAHETLGHFGFRAVVPDRELDAVLSRIYDASPDVQAAVEAKVANEGMSKLEAVEEFLSDNAADLDTSLITRLWNVVKNFLNKLGFKFQDDEARYLINQARRYVRRGEGGHAVSAAEIAAEMQRLDADRSTGRFARYAAGDLASKAHATNAFNKIYSATGGLMGSVEAFYKDVFGKRRDVPGAISRLLEHVQTLDNKARRSYGLNKLYRLLENQQSYARALLSKYQQMTAFTHSPDVGFFGKGVAEADKEKAGELLAHAALLRAAQATDEAIRSYDPLVIVDAEGNVRLNQTEFNAIAKAGMVSAEEFRRGFDVTYADGGKVRFQYDVDEKSPEWKIYVEMRDAVNEAAVDIMLANYQSAQAETNRVVSGLNNNRRGVYRFTQEDLATLRDVARRYQNIRYTGSDVASASVEIKKAADKQSEEFLIAFGRALFNDDVYKVWMKDPTAKPEVLKDLAEFQKAEYDDIRAQLQSLRAKFSGSEDSRREQSFVVQKAIRDLFLFDLQSKNADYYAKRTILGGYVPFTRRGTEQVRLVALDAKGNPAALDENIRATLPYFQFEDRSEALDVAEKLDQEFGGDNEWTLKDAAGNDIKVRFKAEVSRVRQSPDLTEAVNFNEFVYVLNRLNVPLAPQARERIVTTLTRQNDRARKNLMRSGTPGWDKDVVRSVSEFLETSAHVAAKKLYRHRVDDVLLNNDNWLGDDERLKTLKDAVDNAATDGERARARREYEEYAFMYRYMKATGKGNTVEIGGKEVPTLGRGEDYREEAKQVLRWYSEATNITDSTEDLLSGETGSRLKLLTVLMQLGGSVATSAINLASIVTHSLPYLSYRNPKRGFGGGYGEVKAAAALWKAASNLKNPKLADDAFLNELVDDGGFERFGLTEDEARFLRDQSEQGVLSAAQFNALVGTARGKVFNNKAQAAIQLWMSMFSYTEQVNRRVTALAAYRLEKERAQAQGTTDMEDLIAQATEAGRRAVTTAQGEYAMFNRPEMARGNVLQYIFMYKQFVIITVQLMRSLPVKGQLMMLGILLITSGLRGLPFAEDIFDIVDTIAQKLGLKMASVEKSIAEWIDAVAPGMTPYAMRGVLDRVTGATMSTRLGMGDILPLTGAFRAGADPAREAADFAGPVFGGISGLIGMAGSIAKYGAEVTGLRDDTTSFNSILRDSPIAFLRSVGDSYAYLTSGAITNARGQLVASDASYLTSLTRLLGFYPAIASEQNDIVRLSKHVADYTKAIKAEYVSAYVKAKLAGDSETMEQLISDVHQWNADAEGTGLVIRDFVRSANRAALEASRPTVLRYMKAAPRDVRPETLEMLRIMGLEEDVR